MPLWKVWHQLVCHDFVVCSARFKRPFWDYSWIPQLVSGLISTGLLEASHLNSVTNLRAQQARLVKNNCRFFSCLSRTDEIRTCAFVKVWNQFVCPCFVVRSARFNRPFWDYSRISQLVFGLISTSLLDASHLNSVTNLRAQRARLMKNNCRFFRCLSRTWSTTIILCHQRQL